MYNSYELYKSDIDELWTVTYDDNCNIFIFVNATNDSYTRIILSAVSNKGYRQQTFNNSTDIVNDFGSTTLNRTLIEDGVTYYWNPWTYYESGGNTNNAMFGIPIIVAGSPEDAIRYFLNDYIKSADSVDISPIISGIDTIQSNIATNNESLLNTLGNIETILSDQDPSGGLTPEESTALIRLPELFTILLIVVCFYFFRIIIHQIGNNIRGRS